MQVFWLTDNFTRIFLPSTRDPGDELQTLKYRRLPSGQATELVREAMRIFDDCISRLNNNKQAQWNKYEDFVDTHYNDIVKLLFNAGWIRCKYRSYRFYFASTPQTLNKQKHRLKRYATDQRSECIFETPRLFY